ncbi:AMP-dependent synthetase and ligase [Nitzschia inconspicua]|uniref:AMP-dependent synthetase and ligase n=1 Tax=Nitzschia inconspicua TaxID=303405 RepID=A0A9K3L341_9STRA|nr:AMP-dependent synthetase and ligase [Nitzschia inconspicua]
MSFVSSSTAMEHLLSHRRRILGAICRFPSHRRFICGHDLSIKPPHRGTFFVSQTFSSSTNHGPNHLQHNHHHKNLPLKRESIRGEFGAYQDEYNRSLHDLQGFWKDAARALEWFQEPQTVLQQRYPDNPHFHDWFPDGTLNACYNCLDVHVEKNGRGDQVALIYDSPLAGNKKERYTYREMLDQVSTLAGALQDELDVQPGDRVVLYMPLIPQAIFAMLACARIGAIHSVVFGGFAAQELASRISDSTPKVIITASCGIEPTRVVPYRPILDKALEISNHKVDKVVVVQRHDIQGCELGPLDVDFHDLISTSTPANAVPVPSTHPQYILYTSGTTGKPKGIVRDTGGHATALKWSMSNFYGMKPGEVFWTASDVGWVVGHSYIAYGPLLHGCTTILYEGKPVGTPDAGAFWRIIEEYNVKSLFTAPTAFRAIKQADPEAELVKQYDVSSLKNIFVAGEHCDPETIHYLEHALPHIPPPIDHWWQTELGWPGIGNSVGLGRVPVRYGSCSMPVCGYDIKVLNDDGIILPPNTLGSMAIKTPLPPGALQSIYGDEDRMIETYLMKFPGFYATGDAGFLDEDGYVYIMGRTDDIINTAGHRLSTATMEEILLEHPSVADCAVIPVKDKIKGHLPFGYVVCSKGIQPEAYDRICKDLVEMMRDKLGPVAAFKNVRVVKGLPKTRSGKILRGTMSKIANDEPYNITPTIEDASVFDHLIPAIQESVQEKIV